MMVNKPRFHCDGEVEYIAQRKIQDPEEKSFYIYCRKNMVYFRCKRCYMEINVIAKNEEKGWKIINRR